MKIRILRHGHSQSRLLLQTKQSFIPILGSGDTSGGQETWTSTAGFGESGTEAAVDLSGTEEEE
jgi:hypothetical protein